jgi:hypothetical protein
MKATSARLPCVAVSLACLLVAFAVPAWTESPKEKKDERPKLSPAVLALAELAKASEDGKDLKKGTAAIREKYDLDDVKQALLLPKKGGLGYGSKDSKTAIERKVSSLSNRPLTAEALKAESTDLVKMAHVLIATAEVTKLYLPRYDTRWMKKQEWPIACDDMKNGAQELLKAVKAKDTKAVSTATALIEASCYPCHFVGRK